MKTSTLTQKKYWDNNWEKIKLPQIIDIKHSTKSTKELDSIFHKFLNKDENKQLIEIGCAPGTWLDYFYKNFKYKANGIEYTENGVQNTIDNLKILKTPLKLISGDFLKYKFKEQYDVVFSMGFIEHFTSPELIIKKQLDILKKGGLLIIGIPNLRYFNSLVEKIFCSKKIIESHNKKIMTLDFFEKIIKENQIKKVYLDYIGSFNPFLFPIKQTTMVMIVSAIIARVCGLFLKKSKFYSTYILLIAQK